jgi:hypothetical protein
MITCEKHCYFNLEWRKSTTAEKLLSQHTKIFVPQLRVSFIMEKGLLSISKINTVFEKIRFLVNAINLKFTEMIQLP